MDAKEKERIEGLAELMTRISDDPNNTKLTTGLIKSVCEKVMKGCPPRAACQMFGVSDRTYRNWMKWGREEKAPIYMKFVEAVRRSEALYAVEMTSIWDHHARRDWKAAKAFLESRFPEDWGQKRRPERRQLPQPPVVINVTLTNGQSLMDAIPQQYLPHVQVVEKALPPSVGVWPVPGFQAPHATAGHE